MHRPRRRTRPRAAPTISKRGARGHEQDLCDRRRHVEVREAGDQGGRLSRLGGGGGIEGARRRRDPLRRGRAGVRGLRLWRLHVRAAGGLRARAHGHPGGQRQQQLLDRLERAVPRKAGRQGRSDRLRARGGLREDGARLAGHQVHRSHARARQARDAHVRAARRRGLADGSADVRQRRPRPHGALRLEAGALRLDRLEEPQALGQQPVRPVPDRVLARGHRRARR